MLLCYIDSDITDNQTLEVIMFRCSALFIVLALLFFGCSSPEKKAEKAREQAEYDAFKAQTIQLLSTLKAGDLLSMNGGKSYNIVKYITGDQPHLYSLTDPGSGGMHYSCEEIASMFGRRQYLIIRSDDPNWKAIVLQQLVQ